MLSFIDCNCSFGRRKKIYDFSMTDKSEIKNELLKCNVQKAICHHSSAREFHAYEGNKMLINEIKNDDFFIPSYVIIPNHSNDFISLSQLRDEIKENQVKLIKMFPSRGEQSFSLKEWNMKEIFDFLQEINIPLMLTYKNVDADMVEDILRNHKSLKIILTDTSYFFDKELMRLMDLYENIYLETSNYTTLDGIEYITNNYGANRLLFGSGLPFVSIGAAVTKILLADISDNAKEDIARKNIEKIMSEVRV